MLPPSSVWTVSREERSGGLGALISQVEIGKLRIVEILTRSDTLAGAQLHVRDLSERLIALGHEVTVLVGQSGPLTDALDRAGVPFVSLQHLLRPLHPLGDLRALVEIRRHLRRIRPDLVATHSAKAGWIGRAAARAAGIPAVFTAHGWSFTEGLSRKRRIASVLAERLVAPLAKRIIVVSEYDRQLGLKHRICPEDKLVRIHNGVRDTPHRGSPGDVRPRTRLVMVARLDAPKRHRDLFEALAAMGDATWELDLVGDGPWEGQLRDETVRLGIAQRVRFLGLRTDVPEIVAQAQIGILVSGFEGFPLVTLEYMRAGLPVVASDAGGISEAVRDGSNGFVTVRGDIAGLCDALRKLMNAPSLRAALGAKGREDYLRHFTFDRMAEATLATYRAVVEGAGGRTGSPRSLRADG